MQGREAAGVEMTARTAVGPGQMLGSGPRHGTRASRPTQVTAGVCVPATRSAALLEISCDEQEASWRRVLARRGQASNSRDAHESVVTFTPSGHET